MDDGDENNVHKHSLLINGEYEVILPNKTNGKTSLKKATSKPTNIDSSDMVTDDLSQVKTVRKPKDENLVWWNKTLKVLQKTFFVIESGVVTSSATFKVFSPWPFQQCFTDYVKRTFDWPKKHDPHYLPRLVYCKAGSGKTALFWYAFQRNPPKKLAIVCDISIIASRWLEELYTYFPPLFGTTEIEVYGYDEFDRISRDDTGIHWDKVLVFDESQELRTLQPGMMVTLEASRKCLVSMGSTGTPFMNTRADVIGLNVFMEVSPLQTMKEIMENPIDNELVEMNTNPKKYFKNMLNKYKDRIFFFEPTNPVKTINVDIEIEMPWLQTYEYIMHSRKTINIGGISITSAIRNSFDSMLRRVSNCLYAEDEKTLIVAPKFQYILDRINKIMQIKDTKLLAEAKQKHFPMVIVSRYNHRGIIGCEKYISQVISQYGLKVASMNGETKFKDRQNICDDFEQGKLDILLLARVGKRGVSLPGAKSITLMEIPDSNNDQEQFQSRCLRWGKVSEQNNDTAITIYRLISKFPSKPPSKEEKSVIIKRLADAIRMTPKQLESEMNVMDELKKHIIRLENVTVDEKCAIRNPEKSKELEIPELVLKGASIPFENAPQKYIQELETRLK